MSLRQRGRVFQRTRKLIEPAVSKRALPTSTAHPRPEDPIDAFPFGVPVVLETKDVARAYVFPATETSPFCRGPEDELVEANDAIRRFCSWNRRDLMLDTNVRMNSARIPQ